MKSIVGKYINDRNAYLMQEEPMIFHCHHYNCFLQKLIESTSEYINVQRILVDSAQEVSYSIFRSFFDTNELNAADKIAAIAELHRYCGYGTLDLSGANENGGEVSSNSNHYVEGWLTKFGKRNEDESGVALFTAGFIAGALDAAYDQELGTFGAEQISCKTKGDSENIFKITLEHKKGLKPSPQEGTYQTKTMTNHPDSGVDYLGIREALTSMDIVGNEEGLISAFGVMLTRMFSNYYVLISFKFLNKMNEEMGEDGVQIAEELLIEAGHICAFNTFGGIMESAEWNGMIKPMLKTREDWVHGIVACCNTLGWGHYEVKELIPNKKLVLEVTSGYENNAFTKTFGKSERPISFLNIGGGAGIMNLIYHGDITEAPELNEKYYNDLFKTKGRFVGKQISCRSMGDSSDLISVERIDE